MSRDGRRIAALALGTAVAFELGLRILVSPSQEAFGVLLGQNLPPLRFVMESGVDPNSDDKPWKHKTIPNPEHLTHGDLWGILREDRAAGYTNQENRRSRHGWWQSNNVGARARVLTEPQPRPGTTRLVVLGASYAQGSRVPQDETWFARLSKAHAQTEIVNLAVDGFSMGQCLMRFREFRRTHDTDACVFVFVPDNNIWRDVNTSRFLGERWWAFTVLPRYVVENGQAKLVPGPYPIISDIYKHDLPTPTPAVVEHLRQYDPFFVPMLYQIPPILGHLVTYKIVACILGERRRAQIYENCRSDPDCEGMEVIRAIFKSTAEEMRRAGKRMAVVLLPDTEILEEIRGNAGSGRVAIWNARVERLRADGLKVVDLLPFMRAMPAAEMDRGKDGTHYGPRTNAAIGRALEGELGKAGLLR